MKIIWTRHAEERQEEWRKKLGIWTSKVEKYWREEQDANPI